MNKRQRKKMEKKQGAGLALRETIRRVNPQTVIIDSCARLWEQIIRTIAEDEVKHRQVVEVTDYEDITYKRIG